LYWGKKLQNPRYKVFTMRIYIEIPAGFSYYFYI